MIIIPIFVVNIRNHTFFAGGQNSEQKLFGGGLPALPVTPMKTVRFSVGRQRLATATQALSTRASPKTRRTSLAAASRTRLTMGVRTEVNWHLDDGCC